MLDALVLPAFILASTVGVAALRLAFTPERRIKRALRRVKPTRVCDVRDGRVVKLVGEVVYAGRTLASPLSRRDCAYYSVVVKQYAPRTGRPAKWNEIVREERGVDFYVRDGSGMALVRLTERSTWAALIRDHQARTSPILLSDAELERLVTERGHATKGAFFRKRLRAYEGVLVEGERVAVGGLARWAADPDAAGAGYRDPGKRLVLEASDALPLFFSDDPSAF